MVITMAKLRMAHAITHGACKHAWRTQSVWAKILGETNFHTREFPRSGSKAKDGEREKKERKREERKLAITMASYALQTPPRVAHTKPPGPIFFVQCLISAMFIRFSSSVLLCKPVDFVWIVLHYEFF